MRNQKASEGFLTPASNSSHKGTKKLNFSFISAKKKIIHFNGEYNLMKTRDSLIANYVYVTIHEIACCGKDFRLRERGKYLQYR